MGLPIPDVYCSEEYRDSSNVVQISASNYVVCSAYSLVLTSYPYVMYALQAVSPFIQINVLDSFTVTLPTLLTPPTPPALSMQLESNLSLRACMKKLWQEEGLTILYKGLSARIMQNAPTSGLMILGYETLKRLCLKTT